MSAPVWQPGTVYLPGALARPATVPPVVPVAPANPGFETGDATGWTLGANMSVAQFGVYEGLWALQLDIGVTTGASGQEAVNATEVAVVAGQLINARCMIHQGASDVGKAGGYVRVKWYDAAHAFLANADGNNVIDGRGGAILPSTVAATAPAAARFARIAAVLYRVGENFPTNADAFTWDYKTPGDTGLIYKAVQPAAGTSGSSEPAWPPTLGVQVIDGGVTWEAVQITRVTWEASPILLSGGTEPAWPTQPGASIIDGTIAWECISRRVEDENCPNSKVVAIMASKVFAADRDIVRFSATANPLDWTTANDAGYLPTGLQQANANDMAVLAPYRGNLSAFNASSFQMWQVDPDPAAMALLDQMEGVGSTWQHAAQPVGNELVYLSALGVRTVGIAGASTNLKAGDIGMPIDPLVQAAMADDPAPLATYYPSAGQYWLTFKDHVPVLVGEMDPRGVMEVGEAYTVNLDADVYGGLVTCTPVTPVSAEFVSGTVYMTETGEFPTEISTSHCVDYDAPVGTPSASTATAAGLVATFPRPPVGNLVLIDSYFLITCNDGNTYMTRVQAKQF